jgi:hypothetical protein
MGILYVYNIIECDVQYNASHYRLSYFNIDDTRVMLRTFIEMIFPAVRSIVFDNCGSFLSYLTFFVRTEQTFFIYFILLIPALVIFRLALVTFRVSFNHLFFKAVNYHHYYINNYRTGLV